jgi:pseudouridine-5'-phosphate glycosidase
MRLPEYYKLSKEIALSLEIGAPIVALETTVVTHGLPYPENVYLAAKMESAIREEGGLPATVGVLHGKILIGMTQSELEELAINPGRTKISTRDLGPVLARGGCGGTTVASTLIAAKTAGIKVFATGGIGGVHRDATYDISADLPELARSPLVVVCAGAKSILDLQGTMEYLETSGVPVLGYQTDELPAFFSKNSGIPIHIRTDTVSEIVEIVRVHRKIGNQSAILVTIPPPAETSIPKQVADEAITLALKEAKEKNILGKDVTPFLLTKVSDLTGKSSLRANLALLVNNARLAARIAVAMTSDGKTRVA